MGRAQPAPEPWAAVGPGPGQRPRARARPGPCEIYVCIGIEFISTKCIGIESNFGTGR